ncbi:MAG TPA: hypothetical protein VJT32_00605 [bacterium]|nr:hypothetical protein [bacterium]
MSTVATVSLVVIAATCVIAVAAFVVFLALLWRVVARVDAILTLIQRALPGMVTDARRILTRVDREILDEVVRDLERVSAVVGSGVNTLEHVQQTVRRVAQDVILPPMATAAGLLSALREGLQWFRPSGDGSRR